MPYTAYWEEKGVHWVFTGDVSNEEMFASNVEIYEDPRFPDIQYGIVNYLAVDHYNVSSDAIFNLATMDKVASQRNPHLKLAVIATTQLLKGLTRMWELSGGSSVWEYKIFEDETSAREWLNQ